MTLHTAVTRLQAISISSSDLAIKSAPDYPVSDASVAPFTIAYIGSGEVMATSGTTTRYIVNLYVDFYTNVQILKDAFTKADAYVMEFPRKLAGDPTLGGAVDTIVFPILITEPARREWNGVQFLFRRFTVPVKILDNPIAP